jgi:hypothetical protein
VMRYAKQGHAPFLTTLVWKLHWKDHTRSLSAVGLGSGLQCGLTFGESPQCAWHATTRRFTAVCFTQHDSVRAEVTFWRRGAGTVAPAPGASNHNGRS